MSNSIKKGICTGLIIAGIYVIFVLYLLFVSNRIEKLDNRSNDDVRVVTLKIGD